MCRKNKIRIVMSLMLSLCIGVYGQEYKGQKEGSFIKVLGTSTLHDWEESAEDFSTKLTLASSETIKIKALEVSVKAESLESGKSTMNKITYEALKSDKNPNILFSFISQENTTKVKEGVCVVLVKGNLTIAGVKNEITLELETTQKEAEVVLKGKKTIKMTDYGMKPPKAMFGTIKTGNEITIEFITNYKN
ncbi:YceI family protein [Wenyingzhuangia sp. 2_MG-2023]|uniref:YceI family protein n=1 Tax=Wenyingzhuangia sp. 2_MG-2023 TaxID=3062639 RepID=UPI0026E40986|nr:YceI family protein [Wenyingzhuangia sp. 2_MG-2023]MDO6737260.1 YceI family protein [Wenyingzhuangia sp. 2_MG-2023]